MTSVTPWFDPAALMWIGPGGGVLEAAWGGALGLLAYAMIRLSFLFVPAAVDGTEFGLARSWELTKGNFWRILAVGLATILPLALVLGAAELAILGPEYLANVAAMIRDPAHSATYVAVAAQLEAPKMPMLLGLSFVVTPITNGLLFAPAAYAYRVLSGRGDSSA